MDLKSYIKAVGGPMKFSQKHKWISYRSAISYSCGARTPRPKVAKRLIAESPVTWEGIYGFVSSDARNGVTEGREQTT